MRKIPILLLLSIFAYTSHAQTTTLLETKGSSGTGSWTARQAKLMTLLPNFTPITDASTLDVNKYGSTNLISATATGFFYTKKMGSRWWIIDPEGKAQLNIAMNSLYNLANDAAVAVASDRLWALGFNGIGNFLSDENQTVRYNSTHTNQFSYTRRINFFLGYKNVRKNYYTTPTAIQGDLNYIFVLDPKFAEYCDTQAQKFEQYKTEKNLLGYFIDNEINFNQDQLPNFLTDLSAGDPSYDAALAFATANGLTKAQVVAGQTKDSVLQAFATLLAEHYYEVTSAALKKYDPNHLNLGSRLHGRPRGIEGVVKAAAKWCDVVSVNFYDNYSPDNQITNANTYLKWMDKPCIVSEFYVKGTDAVTAGWVTGYSGAGWVVKTQMDRGAWYQNTCIELLKSDRFVGWHWFKYRDDDESNKGIVKNETNGGSEYVDLTNQMTLLHTNRFGLVNYFDGNSSVKTAQSQSILISKSDKNLMINGCAEKSSLKIYDCSGKQIRTLDMDETYKTVSLNGMQKGIYFIKINSVSGRTQLRTKFTI
ncbi:MAG: T9SS type A sorting domain-containing protein [Bacteroidia bacterium]|nr:T9SS type A sorting domain-containing protein [Bacteroidia bacterium]